jgi:spore germination protein
MENGNIPSTNGHIFLDQYFGEGQDVFLPLLVKGPKNVLQMDGVGVFRGDKLRLLLTNEKGLFIKLLKDNKNDIRSSTYSFKNDQDKQISFKIIYSERKMIVENEVATTLNVFENSNDMLNLKKQIEDNLTVKIKVLLENFQMNLVDPIGIGNLYSTRHKKWNEQEFTAQIYPNIKFNVSTDVEILSLGVGQ